MIHGRAWLLAHLPHQGAMNLLDEIVSWDETHVRAIALRHREPTHPLRLAGLLPIACGIEYGAQAAAAHGALLSSRPSGDGFLASVRSVDFHATRLDDVPGPIDVLGEKLGDSASGVLYRFEIASAGRTLLEGRLTVAFAR